MSSLKNDKTSTLVEDKIEKAVSSVNLEHLRKSIVPIKRNLVKVECTVCSKTYNIVKKINKSFYCDCLTQLAKSTAGKAVILGKVVSKQ